MDFKKHVAELLNKELAIDTSSLIEIPPNPEQGDFAFPCFTQAKTFKKAPKAIAEEIAKKLQKTKFLEKIEASGPYVNFFINKPAFIEQTLSSILSKKKPAKNNKTVLVEYSSPNIAKPFGLGHLMTTIIGNSIAKTYSYLGYNAVSINHLGDWGTQFGKLIVAFKKWGKKQELQKDPIKHLLHLYIKFHDEAKDNPELEQEARNAFRLLEEGTKEAKALWKQFTALSLKEFKKLYKELKIKFDSYRGESSYQEDIPKVIQLLQNKSLLKESEGAFIIDLEPQNMGIAIIQKSDDSSLYLTRDLAAAMYRYNTYKFHKSIYVTDMRQNLHFKQLFTILEMAGFPWSSQLMHVDYGLMKMEDGVMSTREGRMVLVEDLLKTAQDSILKVMQEKKQKPSLEIAKKVGYGAIFFWILAHDRHKDILFKWEDVLDYNGETGPYLQYAYVRARSILAKAPYLKGKVNYGLLKNPKEFALTKHLSRFNEVVKMAAEVYKPSLISRFLLDAAQLFNEFYQECQCISEDKGMTLARLQLVDAFGNVIKQGLALLGVECPERM